MTGPVLCWSAALPAVEEREMLRYAGQRKADETVLALARDARQEGERVLRPAVCWRETTLRVEGETVDLGFAAVHSARLAHALRGCEQAVVFAATVGLALDRLIARYGRLQPARGLMLQALGAERVEALCDAFCDHLAREYAPSGRYPRRRFSPGYGDLPLQAQRELFAFLDCQRRIGLYLNESLLMSPTKSVTAIVGLGSEPDCRAAGCESCGKTDCAMRK